MAKYADYQAVADIFEAMRVETIDGLSVAEMVGGGYPMPVAAHFLDVLSSQAGLDARDHVLDIGCGCGRLAAALTQHIGPHGSYCGVDIIPGLVNFANHHIAPRFAHFRFMTLDRSNPGYDRWRHGDAPATLSTLDAASEPGSITLCIATSLFTHLDSAMAAETLGAIHRALAPEGRALISLFLLDAGVRALMQEGRAAFRFAHRYGEGVFVEDPAYPLGAVAFAHDHFVGLLTRHGLYIERQLNGNWPGRPHHVSGQDILILRRMPGMTPTPQVAVVSGSTVVSSVAKPATFSDKGCGTSLVGNRAGQQAVQDEVSVSKSTEVSVPAQRQVPSDVIAAAEVRARDFGVAPALHPDDYIFWYIHDQPTLADKAKAVDEYFQSGKDTAAFIKTILDENNLALLLAARPMPEKPLTLLEFASGYCRVTRHVPVLLPGIEVTACDIHSQAVEFARQLGFPALQSASVPEALNLERTFDVIFAFSFFTHMPRSTWGRWLQALGRQLAPNGLLIFTAHGEISQKWMGVGALEEDGFFFHAASEQKDLSEAEYGNTVTAFEFVYPEVRKSGLKLLQFRQATAGHHDLYVLHNDTKVSTYNQTTPARPDESRLVGENLRLEAQVASLYASTSWRLTKPLRSFAQALKGR